MICRRFGSAAAAILTAKVGIAILLLAVATGMPRAAYAHNGLKTSSPASGEIVAKRLTEIRLVFMEKPELAFTSVVLVGQDGSVVVLGSTVANGNAITLQVDQTLVPGRYRLTWKTGGRDGHPVGGSFGFVVSETAVTNRGSKAPVPPATAAALPVESHHDPQSMPIGRSFDSQSAGYVIIRASQFAALLILIGAFAFWYVVLGILRRRDPASPLPAIARGRLERMAVFSAAALVALALARLLAQSIAMHGENQPVLAVMWPMLSGTTWGLGWILQLAGCVVILVAFRSPTSKSRNSWPIAAVGVLAVVFSPALSGHAASAPRLTFAAVLFDGFHIVGAGGWLGSLLMVLIIGIPAARTLASEEIGPAVASLVNSFSPAALCFASLAGLTGLFAAWLHVGSVRGLWETTYGQTLLLKVAILSIVVATGAYNWLRVKPALGKPEATQRLGRSARIEVGVAVLVIAVTAVLVATPAAVDENRTRVDASSVP